MSETNTFSKRLREARAEIGVSQKNLGIRIGMEASSASGRMNHYETGRHTPDFQTIERLAKELNKPVAYFFCEKDSLAELIKILDSLSEQERQVLIDSLT